MDLPFSSKSNSKFPTTRKNTMSNHFQGWLNLLEGQEYSPETYHISNTEPVFVKLEATSLKMKKPLETDIPKRAMWNEPVHNITFVKQVER